MQVALNKVLAELNKQTRREPNDEDPLTLPTFAATSAPASQVSAGDGVKRVHSGSDLASASEASHDDPVSLLRVLVTWILVSISTMMRCELFTDDAAVLTAFTPIFGAVPGRRKAPPGAHRNCVSIPSPVSLIDLHLFCSSTVRQPMFCDEQQLTVRPLTKRFCLSMLRSPTVVLLCR